MGLPVWTWHSFLQLDVCTECDINLMHGRATGTLGAIYRFRTSTVHVQGSTEGVVAVTLEKQLVGPNVTLGLMAMMDHTNAKSAFGLSFNFSM